MDASLRAIVLFGHGSRDPLWHQPMQAVERSIRLQAPQMQVRCAYLELTQPDLQGASADLVSAGVRHITIVPMFLGVGRHAREDLPALVQALRVRYPDVVFKLQCAVGEDLRLIEQLAQIALC
ncbi:MAG: CbiX/SirB N-terminal domain-containing protein [Betaproteobacteria bacterium]